MNALDELLTAASPVPDISPDGLRNGRAALDAAFGTALGASAAEAGRKPGGWLSGVRAKALIGTAVATAGAAAAATVIAMPSSPAGPSAGPTATVPKGPVAPTMTAMTVLDQAAQAAGSQPGWPNAQYWYVEDQYTCGGQLYSDKVWLSRHGKGVVEKTGPANGGSPCSGDLFTAPVLGDNKFGPYTWSQLYTLPADPTKLKPKLMADFPSVTDQQVLFEDVEILLTDTPAPPAVREALFKVDAGIPGVKVMGHYTDSLGRTGTALHLGRVTMVIDPANGVVLDETDSGSTTMFVTQGPAASEPKLTGG